MDQAQPVVVFRIFGLQFDRPPRQGFGFLLMPLVQQGKAEVDEQAAVFRVQGQCLPPRTLGFRIPFQDQEAAAEQLPNERRVPVMGQLGLHQLQCVLRPPCGEKRLKPQAHHGRLKHAGGAHRMLRDRRYSARSL